MEAAREKRLQFYNKCDEREKRMLLNTMYGFRMFLLKPILTEFRSYRSQAKEKKTYSPILCIRNWNSSFCDWLKLPEDLLVEILCRLSAEELSRCKTVCSIWNRLITNVCIPKMFLSSDVYGFLYNSKSDPLLEFTIYRLPTIPVLGPEIACYVLLSFMMHMPDFLSFCNGLTLFTHSSTRQFYVCNPATSQCLTIPTCPEACQNLQFNSLAFDPRRSLHFKLVCFNCKFSPATIYVFSSDTCRWDIHEVKFEHPATTHSWYKPAVYSNGVLCYLSESKHLICLGIDRMNACAIDLPGKDGMGLLGFIGESKGLLYYSNHDCNNIFIWTLEGYSEDGRWICMHKIFVRDLAANPEVGKTLMYWGTSKFMPYAVHLEANIIFIGTPMKRIAYDFSTCELRNCWSMKEAEFVALGERTSWLYRPCFVNLKILTRHPGSNFM